jgi:hypothetical protein
VTLPPGQIPGTVEVRHRARLHITWHFAPTSDSVHTFDLTYLVRGVVRQAGDADVLRWTALPDEHDYRIATSTIQIALSASPIAPPEIDTRRVEGRPQSEVDDARLRIVGGPIRPDGWIRVIARLPRGSVIEAPPGWQQREQSRNAWAPTWIAGAGVVLAMGLILIFALRQRYDSPPRDNAKVTAGPAPPDTLAPAEAGALVSNGGARMEHAMATLFTLAERGELTIIEDPKRFLAQRRFILARRPARRPVAPYEQAALDIIFTHRGRAEESVTLDQARTRLSWRFARFRRPLQAELGARGLLDAGRKAVRDRFAYLGVALLLLAGLAAAIMGVLFVDDYGGWPLLIPAALAVTGIVAFISHAAHTPLSNEGVRRARQWRAFRDYLKQVAQDRAAVPAGGTGRLLPFAIALGLADSWSKFLKKHRLSVPAWFQAAAADRHTAFVAFVAHGAAHGHGAHGGAGGAGGGASGAR